MWQLETPIIPIAVGVEGLVKRFILKRFLVNKTLERYNAQILRKALQYNLQQKKISTK